MKIKLINYPYLDYEIGEIVDLGEEKNKSMVALQRAVFVEEAEKEKKPKKKTPKTTTQAKKTSKPKKLLTNKLGEEVQKKKKQIETEEAEEEKDEDEPEGKNFWDKLKK